MLDLGQIVAYVLVVAALFLVPGPAVLLHLSGALHLGLGVQLALQEQR